MRTKYTLSTTEWTPISEEGQSGLAVVREAKWNGRVFVDESSTGTAGCSKAKASTVFCESALYSGVALDADDDTTIFYAIALDSGAEIIADMA